MAKPGGTAGHRSKFVSFLNIMKAYKILFPMQFVSCQEHSALVVWLFVFCIHVDVWNIN